MTDRKLEVLKEFKEKVDELISVFVAKVSTEEKIKPGFYSIKPEFINGRHDMDTADSYFHIGTGYGAASGGTFLLVKVEAIEGSTVRFRFGMNQRLVLEGELHGLRICSIDDFLHYYEPYTENDEKNLKWYMLKDGFRVETNKKTIGPWFLAAGACFDVGGEHSHYVKADCGTEEVTFFYREKYGVKPEIKLVCKRKDFAAYYDIENPMTDEQMVLHVEKEMKKLVSLRNSLKDLLI